MTQEAEVQRIFVGHTHIERSGNDYIDPVDYIRLRQSLRVELFDKLHDEGLIPVGDLLWHERRSTLTWIGKDVADEQWELYIEVSITGAPEQET